MTDEIAKSQYYTRRPSRRRRRPATPRAQPDGGAPVASAKAIAVDRAAPGRRRDRYRSVEINTGLPEPAQVPFSSLSSGASGSLHGQQASGLENLHRDEHGIIWSVALGKPAERRKSEG